MESPAEVLQFPFYGMLRMDRSCRLEIYCTCSIWEGMGVRCQSIHKSSQVKLVQKRRRKKIRWGTRLKGTVFRRSCTSYSNSFERCWVIFGIEGLWCKQPHLVFWERWSCCKPFVRFKSCKTLFLFIGSRTSYFISLKHYSLIDVCLPLQNLSCFKSALQIKIARQC